MTGYVYAMLHPAHPKLVVVASATSDPDDPSRIADLAPFVVIFSRKVFAEVLVFKEIIRVLNHYGHAVAENPNYFSCTPTMAITVLLAVSDVAERHLAEEKSASTGDDDSQSEADTFYDAGCAAAIGSGDALEDHREALLLLEQAAELGCVRAYDDMGDIYYTSDTVKNERRALEAWKEGSSKGSAGCWAQLGNHYDRDRHQENAKKCWDRFFTMLATMCSDSVLEVSSHVSNVLLHHSASFFVPLYVFGLKPHSETLRAHFERLITMLEERGSRDRADSFRRVRDAFITLTKQ